MTLGGLDQSQASIAPIPAPIGPFTHSHLIQAVIYMHHITLVSFSFRLLNYDPMIGYPFPLKSQMFNDNLFSRVQVVCH